MVMVMFMFMFMMPLSARRRRETVKPGIPPLSGRRSTGEAADEVKKCNAVGKITVFGRKAVQKGLLAVSRNRTVQRQFPIEQGCAFLFVKEDCPGHLLTGLKPEAGVIEPVPVLIQGQEGDLPRRAVYLVLRIQPLLNADPCNVFVDPLNFLLGQPPFPPHIRPSFRFCLWPGSSVPGLPEAGSVRHTALPSSAGPQPNQPEKRQAAPASASAEAFQGDGGSGLPLP